MKLLLLVVVLVFLAALAVAIQAKRGAGANRSPITRRPPLTKREQSMHFRLVQSLPEHVVLAQVAFSALLSAKTTPTRNTFDRKVADFVVCSKAFEVVAVVELDDATHKGREGADAKRDALLTSAGYRVLRYANIPDIAKVQNDFTTPLPSHPLELSA